MTRVLIVDDDDLMRAGLVELLSADPDIEIVGEASTGREAVERARRLAPDVVLMDVRMPDLDGIAATRELASAAPGARVVILTTFEQDDYIFGGLRAGASGFLLKRTRPEELLAAVHTIAAGDSLLSPSVTRRVIDRMAQQPTPELADQAKLDELTPRERQVLVIARGLANHEIAAALTVEESTIRTHVKRILMKLGLRDRIQAVMFAYETGLNRPAAGAQRTTPRDGAAGVERDPSVAGGRSRGFVRQARPPLPFNGVEAHVGQRQRLSTGAAPDDRDRPASMRGWRIPGPAVSAVRARPARCRRRASRCSAQRVGRRSAPEHWPSRMPAGSDRQRSSTGFSQRLGSAGPLDRSSA